MLCAGLSRFGLKACGLLGIDHTATATISRSNSLCEGGQQVDAASVVTRVVAGEANSYSNDKAHLRVSWDASWHEGIPVTE